MIVSCPHCSSNKFKIVGDNIVLCQFCRQELHLALDEIEHCIENKPLLEELIEDCYKKIAILNKEKRQAHACLLYYKKLANPKRPVIVFGISLAFAIFLILLSPYMYPINHNFGVVYTICTALLALISLSGFLFAKKYHKKRRQKYQPHISFYASEIVKYENEIEIYSKQISKLIK